MFSDLHDLHDKTSCFQNDQLMISVAKFFRPSISQLKFKMPGRLKASFFVAFFSIGIGFFWYHWFRVAPLENLIFESSSTVDGSEIWFTSWGKCTLSHDLQGFSTIQGGFLAGFLNHPSAATPRGPGKSGELRGTTMADTWTDPNQAWRLFFLEPSELGDQKRMGHLV